MGCLPDELWTKILGLGIENQVLDYRDLCSLAFVCRRIRRISSLECIWRPLWERDQAQLGGNSILEKRKENEIKSFRDYYRIRLISLFWCFDDVMLSVTFTLLSDMSWLGFVLCMCCDILICDVTGNLNILILWFPNSVTIWTFFELFSNLCMCTYILRAESLKTESEKTQCKAIKENAIELFLGTRICYLLVLWW